jgi:hypothetical protein
LAVPEGALETGNELASKNATEHMDGKKELVVGFNPKGVIEREPTGGNDTALLDHKVRGTSRVEGIGLVGKRRQVQ